MHPALYGDQLQITMPVKLDVMQAVWTGCHADSLSVFSAHISQICSCEVEDAPNLRVIAHAWHMLGCSMLPLV